MSVKTVNKLKNILTAICLLVMAITLFNCGGKPEPVHDEKTGYTFYGDSFDPDGTMSVDQLLGAMKSRDTVAAVVRAKVESVCQVKGCWMNVVDDQKEGTAFFVKFKDYGFFVPMDISDQEVIMKGIAFKSVTPVDELKHYAEDKGLSQDEIDSITEPKEEYKFMASGVAMNPS